MALPSLSDNSDFEAIIANVAAQLYNGKLADGAIPRELYEQTANTLMSGMFEGLGGKKTFAYDDPNNTLAAYMRQNIHAFSAAKSTVQMKAFNDLLIGPDGKPRSEADFIAQVAKTGALFNKTHLATERNSAIARAQMAQAWDNFTDDEYIQISTAHDADVRPHHAILDGFTDVKSSPVWKRIWPPFDWNCRCHVVPGLAKNKNTTSTPSQLAKDAKVPPYFQTNAGITRTVFGKDHIHFLNTESKLKNIGPKQFNMPSLSDIYKNTDFQKPLKFDSEDEALEWWKSKTSKGIGHFDTTDVLGNTIRFDYEIGRHAIKDNRDERWRILNNIEDIIKQPDEVWSQIVNGKLETSYIKYYENYPMCVSVNELRAYTFLEYSKNGKLNEASYIKDRQGTLLYRH